MERDEKDFLGRGWKFPIEVSGGVITSHYEEKIRQSIIIILSTAKGERVMLPEFGCDINEYTFSVINASTLTLMKSAVKEALLLWEPRIEVRNVSIDTEKLNEGALRMSIDYRVRTTNTDFNLVYPFYLKAGG